MSLTHAKDDDLRKRTLLLREVAELIMWELATISDRKWEALPELKKKKGIMADRLREFDWTPGTEEHESLDLMMLKSQISDLEYQSKQRIAMQLKIIRQQLDVLRDQKQGWLNCVSGYFPTTTTRETANAR
jgi:hypothetical protein